MKNLILLVTIMLMTTSCTEKPLVVKNEKLRLENHFEKVLSYGKENPNDYESLENRYFNLQKHISHYSDLLTENNITDGYSNSSKEKVTERIQFYADKKNEKKQQENALKSNSINNGNYCNLSQAEALKYIARQSFSVNGKSVSFSTSYDFQREEHIPSEFILNGNTSRFLGRWKMYSNTSIYLFDLIQVSGSFDPTNNKSVSGYLTLQCNGNLIGSVGRGNKQQQLNIIKNN